MRPLRAIGIYLLGVFLGGALLAPWLYRLAELVHDSVPRIAVAPFHRFVTRSLLIVALAGLWPVLRALGARSLRDLGLTRPRGQGRELLAGLLIGFISFAVVGGLALAGGGREFEASLRAGVVAQRLLNAAASAVVVALMEEVLFRGGVFGGLRRVFDWRLALGISSLVYAVVHFLGRPAGNGGVTWSSGLELLPGMLQGFGEVRELLPGLLNLTLAGALLALAFQRTGHLCVSIGIHAGWIFWMKSYGTFTNAVPSANPWLWGTQRMFDGWIASTVLLGALIAWPRLPIGRSSPSAT